MSARTWKVLDWYANSMGFFLFGITFGIEHSSIGSSVVYALVGAVLVVVSLLCFTLATIAELTER